MLFRSFDNNSSIGFAKVFDSYLGLEFYLDTLGNVYRVEYRLKDLYAFNNTNAIDLSSSISSPSINDTIISPAGAHYPKITA